MFKVGDRVRNIREEHNHKWPKGITGVVTKAGESGHNEDIQYLHVKWDDPEYPPVSWYGYRFELIAPALSDQELADKYRKARKETFDLFDELEARGFLVTIDGNPFRRISDDIEISKYVTTKVNI